jgi:hypothetical protein
MQHEKSKECSQLPGNGLIVAEAASIARPLKLKQEIELEIAQCFFMEDGAYSKMAMDDLRG